MTKTTAAAVAAIFALTAGASTPSSKISDNLTISTEQTSIHKAPLGKTIKLPSAKAAAREMSSRIPGKGISLKGNKKSRHLSPLAATDAPDFFYESFEYDDNPYAWSDLTAELAWLPEGWTRVSNSSVDGSLDKWYAYPLYPFTFIPCYEGNYVMALLYNSEPKDEWLISPEIEIGEGQYLTFAWYELPAYFWVIDSKHVDFENGVFTNREISATTKVLVSADGGEWVEIKDMSEDFADMEYGELTDIYPEEMMHEKLSLAGFAGHRIRVAFRYVGTDGNSMFIDAVSVNNGIDMLDAIYMSPLSTMYVGGTVGGEILEMGSQFHPTNTDLTWTNRSRNEIDTEYTWGYVGLPVTDENEDEITINFPIPETIDDEPFETYLPLSLMAEAHGIKESLYAENVVFMAGGKSIVEDETLGLLPFDHINYGTSIHTAEPEDFGQRGIPIFGYNDATDRFWFNYTSGGADATETAIEYAHLTGIINGIIPSEAPMVVNGAWLYAIGLVDETAQLTCSIYSLDEDGELTDLVASKTVTGKDFKIIDTRMNLYYYSIPFAFDKPVVLDRKGTEGDFYAVIVEGFHDGGVEYFAPVMQTIADPFENCFGFYQIEIGFNGEDLIGMGYVSDHANDYGDMYCAFAINLDAEYPWLESEVEQITLDEGSYQLHLRSFYHARDLKVMQADGSPLPEWITVTPAGRYDNAKLTFKATDSAKNIDSDIIISAPGVQKRMHISKTAGVETILDSDSQTVVGVYDLMGRRVDENIKTPGFYILRTSDGESKITRY